MTSEAIEIIAELAISNGYTLEDKVSVTYTEPNRITHRKMSFIDSLGKLEKKLNKEPLTIGVDFKVML